MSVEEPRFAPIERESVAEKVARRILELVRSGSLKAGDQLPPERALAGMFQVSRPSVREAIRGLAILGVVRTRQGGGAYISSLDAEELLEPLHFYITLDHLTVDALYEARIEVEGVIARHAAERISAADLDKLSAMLRPQRRLVEDPVGFRLSDQEFHDTIWRAAGNPFLERVARSLNVLGMEYRRIATQSSAVLRQSVVDHQAIVAALAARDPDAAARAMTGHMKNIHASTLCAMTTDDTAPPAA